MFKASGKVYVLGDNIGGRNCRVLDISVLKEAIKAEKVPVVSHFVDGGDKVLGHAELKATDDGIYADLTLYSEDDELDPELRLGFVANEVKLERDDIGEVVKNMTIRGLTLNHAGLGGYLENLTKK